MTRRDLLVSAPAAWLGLGRMPLAWAANAKADKRKVLYFTRSAGYEHSVVQRHGSALSHSETNLIEIGRRAGFDVECTKDGRVFDGNLDPYDAIAFYTSGMLTGPAKDGSPPMSAAGKQKLLDAIAAGKGFVGFHAATDSFRSDGTAGKPAAVDPFTAMIGAEFVVHGAQQEASLLATSDFFAKSIGVPSNSLSFYEEWYTFKNFATDLHVILVQETKYMKGPVYQRPDYPSTWARMHGKGRVFYTALGHREDIWTNPFFQGIARAGVEWTTGLFQFDIKPNFETVTPGANQ